MTAKLHYLRGDQNIVFQAHDKRDEAREAVKRLKESIDMNDEADAEAVADRLGMYFTTLMALERKQRQAEDAVDTLEHLRKRMDESARRTLDRLQEILGTTPTVAPKDFIRRMRERIPLLRGKRRF